MGLRITQSVRHTGNQYREKLLPVTQSVKSLVSGLLFTQTLHRKEILIMAIVSAGFFCSVTLADSEGSTSVLQYPLTLAVDFTDATAAASAILSALVPVTDAVIKGWSVSQKFVENALTLPTGAEVEKRAVITGRISGSVPVKFANVIIPAPSQGIFQAATGSGARLIDKADTDLQNYLALFEVTSGVASLSDGEYLADTSVPENIEGRKMHRGSRSG